MQVEQRSVATHEVDALVVVHPSERGLRSRGAGHECDARVARKLARLDEIDDAFGEELVDRVTVDFELDEPRPTAVTGGELIAVFVGVEADDARLEPER